MDDQINNEYSYRALVVDKNPITRYLVASLLKRQEFQVFDTCKYEAAIQAFITLKPSLVILAQDLDGLNGLEIAHFIRSLTSGSYTHIVLHTHQPKLCLHTSVYYSCINNYIRKGDIQELERIIKAHRENGSAVIRPRETELNE